MTDWYRTADWDDVARAQFEQRLKRARASSRCQYLSIKALALAEAGLLDEARELLGRAVSVLDSYSFEVARAYELLGDLARQQGRLAEAEDHYRRVLASAPDGSGTSELVVTYLAEVLLRAERADEAWQALQVQEDDLPSFNNHLFEYLLRRAQAAEATGQADESAMAARAALALVDAPAQFRRHPDVGLVSTDDETLGYLRAKAG